MAGKSVKIAFSPNPGLALEEIFMNRSLRGHLPGCPPWLPAAMLVVMLGAAAGGYEALDRHQGHPAGPARASAADPAPRGPGHSAASRTAGGGVTGGVAGGGRSGGGPADSGLADGGQPGTGQAGAGRAGTGQGGTGQADGGRTGTGQAGAGRAGTGQAGTGQAGTGQAGGGQAGTGQAGAGRAGPQLSLVAREVRQSATARAAVLRVVRDVNACTMNPATGMRVVYGAIRRRERALDRLGTVQVSAVPGGRVMSADLGLALRESIAADQDFIGWMQDIQDTGCPVRPGHDLSYQAGLRASARAAADKRAFLARWNRLARRWHQPVFTAAQI
jgi:hypothetical protein